MEKVADSRRRPSRPPELRAALARRDPPTRYRRHSRTPPVRRSNERTSARGPRDAAFGVVAKQRHGFREFPPVDSAPLSGQTARNFRAMDSAFTEIGASERFGFDANWPSSLAFLDDERIAGPAGLNEGADHGGAPPWRPALTGATLASRGELAPACIRSIRSAIAQRRIETAASGPSRSIASVDTVAYGTERFKE